MGFGSSNSKNYDKKLYTNEYIRGDKILLIDEEGVNLGIFSKRDALLKAEEEMKDLIQVGFDPKDKIVTAKIMEIGKYLYSKKKEDGEKKKSQKSKCMKEIKFSYNIGDNDLEMKISQAKKFLESGHTVKFLGQLKGRENIYADKLYSRLEYIMSLLIDISKGQGIKKEKRGYSMILFAKVK
ncbi:translation initiation factor IF-3 [Candidatus Vampirococcus lugosii]|uniref:Translation initiation factor IF-3 n=1 Tax=Candidatus Vampirococcus lugosii TaxID=2789015 RepID=A0ABS5QJH9_9BACT|nr:translation initiation factor IF-3 [Candidatus Vampirococcus lugosii]MBS8121451.1 translation initiation factor IF-3 [Candidatus Vampirococcus lugosii]